MRINLWFDFIEKCLRCLPHDEDTGGFFVAAMRKKISTESTTEAPSSGALAEANEECVPTEGEKKEGGADEAGKKKPFNRYQKNPIDLLQWDDESFQMVSPSPVSLLTPLFFNCDSSFSGERTLWPGECDRQGVLHSRRLQHRCEERACQGGEWGFQERVLHPELHAGHCEGRRQESIEGCHGRREGIRKKSERCICGWRGVRIPSEPGKSSLHLISLISCICMSFEFISAYCMCRLGWCGCHGTMHH